MANELDVLLDKVGDPALRADLRRQVALLRAKRRFGLVFEEHLPERVQLPGHTVRRGTRVVLRDHDGDEPREVVKVDRDQATVQTAEGETETLPVAELVVVADFGEPVYPGLRRLGSIDAGGDKPAHVVIKGENHHALEMLQYTHAGKIDCIYIDPPYNSGARDWKYNNDYVDAEDKYRHSKWLAFMDRRLRLARSLLDPEDSVLLVTVDEKEYLRLGLLLEQVFPGHKRQMVTIVIAPAGQARGQEFARVEEYLFVVYIGAAAVTPTADSMLGATAGAADDAEPAPVQWENLLRRGTSARRVDRPNQFFPIFVDPASRQIVGVGDPLESLTADRESVAPPEGTVAVWPLRSDGTEGRWRVGRDGVVQLLEQGFLRLGRQNKQRGTWSVNYLLRSDVERIESGEIRVTGRAPEGYVLVERATSLATRTLPKTVWNRDAHNAGNHGSSLLRAFLPGRSFPFPKSLYAVEDCLRFFIQAKPGAVVLDFFAGSGTTAHAVARLNREDGGRRQCISITNNEVSAEDAVTLRAQGLRPGDPEWESLGIYEHITRPRITAAVTGSTPEGEPVRGDYRFGERFPFSEGLDENVVFFELTYLDPEEVEISGSFEGIAPLLWLRAGGRGGMIDHDAPCAVDDTYGVLFDTDRWRQFVSDLHEGVKAVFIVTDSTSVFAAVAVELPAGVEAVRLYESYLTTFTLDSRAAVPVEESAE